MVTAAGAVTGAGGGAWICSGVSCSLTAVMLSDASLEPCLRKSLHVFAFSLVGADAAGLALCGTEQERGHDRNILPQHTLTVAGAAFFAAGASLAGFPPFFRKMDGMTGAAPLGSGGTNGACGGASSKTLLGPCHHVSQGSSKSQAVAPIRMPFQGFSFLSDSRREH